MTASMPLVVVSVVNWNTPDRSLACVSALRASRYANFRIVLVDNNSRDDSVARFRAEMPELEVLTSNENRGFAAGHGFALARAQQLGADALWLVNSDALAEPEALQHLVDAQAEHGAAIYGGVPLRRAGDGTTLLDFPAKFLDEQARPRAFLRDAEIPFDADWQQRGTLRVGAVPGSCMLIPLSVVATHGWLDESWFMHCEEIDFCYRLRAAGIARFLVPASRVYYRARNEILLARRYGKPGTAPLIALKKVLRATAALPHGLFRARCILRGAWDGWRGVIGKTLSPDDFL